MIFLVTEILSRRVRYDRRPSSLRCGFSGWPSPSTSKRLSSAGDDAPLPPFNPWPLPGGGVIHAAQPHGLFSPGGPSSRIREGPLATRSIHGTQRPACLCRASIPGLPRGRSTSRASETAHCAHEPRGSACASPAPRSSPRSRTSNSGTKVRCPAIGLERNKSGLSGPVDAGSNNKVARHPRDRASTRN